MYNCDNCGVTVPAGTSIMRYAIMKENGNIAQELKLCSFCNEGVQRGMPLEHLRKMKRTPIGARIKRKKNANKKSVEVRRRQTS